MRNRIEKKFRDLKRQGKKAFIAFITAGDPNLLTTRKLVLSFERSGVDIVELGVPFSDPMADGPVIQRASERALKNQTNLKKILQLVAEIRKTSAIPLALMTYFNPVFRFGVKRFVSAAVKSGVDGVIIPDLPPEEAKELIGSAKKNNLATIFFVSPTSTLERIKLSARVSSGFIYYVSLTGTTGKRLTNLKTLFENIRRIKNITKKPVCVGFGIEKSQQVARLTAIADGVIVGSAIVKQIENNLRKRNLVENVAEFVKRLAQPIKP